MIALVLVLILILILFWWLKPKKKIVKLAPEPVILKEEPVEIKNKELDWNKLSAGEQVQYIADTYFNIHGDTSDSKPKSIEEKAKTIIAELPIDNTSCTDNYKDCYIWANNGDCKINPEYMLYNCAKSCSACKYTNEDKTSLVKLLNSDKPSKCVYYGKEYPDEYQYLNKLYDYTSDIGY